MPAIIPGLEDGGGGGFTIWNVLLSLGGSLVLCLLIAQVYKACHRGLSYSQSFQFSLVLLGMLGCAVMMIAGVSILNAVGIFGVFSFVRFRTAIKDPKDMAYILFVLAVGLAMGTQMYVLGVLTTAIVSAVIIGMTMANFGMTNKHESILRFTYSKNGDGGEDCRPAYEETIARQTSSAHLLSAQSTGDHMELMYGVRPRSASTSTSVVEALSKENGVDHVELFDAKHQVEF